jgi:hypothetical protein
MHAIQWRGSRSVSHTVCPTKKASGRSWRTCGKYSGTMCATTTGGPSREPPAAAGAAAALSPGA